MKLFDAFIKDSGDIELSWDNENQIEVFNVIVRYQRADNVSVADLSLTGLTKLITGV
jgi:hypothetical protein